MKREDLALIRERCTDFRVREKDILKILKAYERTRHLKGFNTWKMPIKVKVSEQIGKPRDLIVRLAFNSNPEDRVATLLSIDFLV